MLFTVTPISLSQHSSSVSVVHVLVSVLPLLGFTTLAFQKRLAIFVDLQLGDRDFRWVNADRNGLAIGFIASDALDVDPPFFAIHLSDFALAVVIVSPHNHHLIISTNRQRTHGIFGAQILAQWCAHQFSPN